MICSLLRHIPPRHIPPVLRQVSKLFSVVYRPIIVALISASVLYVGPLATSALLIFPALLSDTRKNSIGAFFPTSTITGLIGTVGGFAWGVAMDILPAYTASISILIAGAVFRRTRESKGWILSKALRRVSLVGKVFSMYPDMHTCPPVCRLHISRTSPRLGVVTE